MPLVLMWQLLQLLDKVIMFFSFHLQTKWNKIMIIIHLIKHIHLIDVVTNWPTDLGNGEHLRDTW